MLQQAPGRAASTALGGLAGLGQALFEEEGQLKVGEVISEAPASAQIALPGGRRIKVKLQQIVMRFGGAPNAALLAEAQALAESMDVELIWEFAPQHEVDFEQLARDYYGDQPSVLQRCATLLCLQAAPIWFQRKGRGHFRAQDRAQIDKALAAVERRKRLEAQIQAWAEELAAGQWPRQWNGSDESHPDPVDPIALLVRPDKQSMAYRALDAAAKASRISMPNLLLKCGAIADVEQLHRGVFLREQFPRGVEPKSLEEDSGEALRTVQARMESLAIAPVCAFSVDDSSTTEIDDALSVQRHRDPGTAGEAAPCWTIGIHIAVPALLLEAGNRWDLGARERMSTVYAPGEKIQMLPEAIVRMFSLDSGAPRPALSLYLQLDRNYTIVGEATRLERVPIQANLRHDQLEDQVSVEALEDWWQASGLRAAAPTASSGGSQSALQATDNQAAETPPAQDSSSAPLAENLKADLALLWRLSLHWRAQREEQRGRPESRFRSDFQFRIHAGRVEIVERLRDAPLDRIVAELMILANTRWARLLALNRLPGIFRSQQMGKVRMTTHPLPHQGLGLSHYLWATSPLRRYTDLVNQRQLLALTTRQRPPFSSEDTELHAIIAGFDARYEAYASYQDRMERFWSMRWVEQGGERRHLAVALREQRVRLLRAPLHLPLADLPEGHAGRRVWIEVLRMDWVELLVEARMLAWDDKSEPRAEPEPEEG